MRTDLKITGKNEKGSLLNEHMLQEPIQTTNNTKDEEQAFNL